VGFDDHFAPVALTAKAFAVPGGGYWESKLLRELLYGGSQGRAGSAGEVEVNAFEAKCAGMLFRVV
jgi:hypothetical protein